ncbi:MAG: hypothetical protein EYC62_00805 [Alphaproteobacteria bacterium]|nr:MAG: hypothetical protein EYC62_00805 [Alphaproteobacteria bacterium]
MKPETQKQYAATLKIFKAADAYISQHRKVDEAFAALEVERQAMEKGHKEFLATAGHIEARRLLGETTEADSQQVSAGLLQVRDQQDRLAAARSALEERKKTLSAQIEAQAEAANGSLSDLSSAIAKEMDEELRRIVENLNSFAARCYAIYSGTHYDSWRNRDMFSLRINSLESGGNIFEDPTHGKRLEEGAEPVPQWTLDPSAMKIYEQLRDLGQTNRTLQRMEREMLDANVGT